MIPGSSINPVNADGTRIDPVAVPVSVKANTRLLDQYNNPQDANGYYGAGCNVPDQLWPVLYEKAYAKFCLYKMGSLSVAGLNDGNIDPTEISSLTKEQWGGNSAVTMMYMTGLSAYYYPTNLNAYNAIGGATESGRGSFSLPSVWFLL